MTVPHRRQRPSGNATFNYTSFVPVPPQTLPDLQYRLISVPCHLPKSFSVSFPGPSSYHSCMLTTPLLPSNVYPKKTRLAVLRQASIRSSLEEPVLTPASQATSNPSSLSLPSEELFLPSSPSPSLTSSSLPPDELLLSSPPSPPPTSSSVTSSHSSQPPSSVSQTPARPLRHAKGFSTKEDWLERSRVRRSPASARQTKVVVCGGGSFGTAMAHVLAQNGYPVSVLVRKPWVRDEINQEHRNPKYLSEYLLPSNLTATICPEEAFSDAKLCVHAVPVQATREFVTSTLQYYPPDLPILCTSKGLEISSLQLMCDVLPNLLRHDRKYAYLSGPSFAQEIMQGLPTAVVVASSDRNLVTTIASMLSSPYFKVYTSTDIVGLEIAGAIKNVIAIAAGMSEGLGLGTNAMAALVTRGCSEMRRIALAQGASPVTLAGLSGVGDTFLTCFGPLSRNRTVGVRLGRGEKLNDILSTSRQIAEGVPTARALVKWLSGASDENSAAYLRASLKYPILYGVAAILEGHLTPREGLHVLLSMPPRPED